MPKYVEGNFSIMRSFGYVAGTVANKLGLREFSAGYDASDGYETATVGERISELAEKVIPLLPLAISSILGSAPRDFVSPGVPSSLGVPPVPPCAPTPSTSASTCGPCMEAVAELAARVDALELAQKASAIKFDGAVGFTGPTAPTGGSPVCTDDGCDVESPQLIALREEMNALQKSVGYEEKPTESVDDLTSVREEMQRIREAILQSRSARTT